MTNNRKDVNIRDTAWGKFISLNKNLQGYTANFDQPTIYRGSSSMLN